MLQVVVHHVVVKFDYIYMTKGINFEPEVPFDYACTLDLVD
jgi:hypothetical protein